MIHHIRRNNVTISKKLFKIFCDGDLNSYLLEILSKETGFEVEAIVTLQFFPRNFSAKEILFKEAKVLSGTCLWTLWPFLGICLNRTIWILTNNLTFSILGNKYLFWCFQKWQPKQIILLLWSRSSSQTPVLHRAATPPMVPVRQRSSMGKTSKDGNKRC